MTLPYSQACENNKQPILDVIKGYFENQQTILEIGSGTAQHAIYFAEHLRNCFWQTSDQKQYHEGIIARVDTYSYDNLGKPLELDVTQNIWPIQQCQGVFSANTCHIMSWPMVVKMFEGVANILDNDKYFCLYGPFNYDGQYSSMSNAAFDNMLRNRDPESGIRDFEDLLSLADKNNLVFFKRYDLPANNNILVWNKRAD